MRNTGENGIAETNTDTSSATARVRVSLREIRECTFRALSAHGASHGEAATAARLVVDAELQGLRGIRVVLADLERERWAKEAVCITDSASETQADSRSESTGPIVLGDQGGNRLLRHLPLAAHLAAAEPGRGVYVPGDMSEVACVDAVLIEVAEAVGRPIGLVQVSRGDHSAFRLALADGSLGSGAVQALTEWGGDDLSALTDHDPGADGVWLFVAADADAKTGQNLTWASAHTRRDARACAASEGRLITADAWWALYAASRRYLVSA